MPIRNLDENYRFGNADAARTALQRRPGFGFGGRMGSLPATPSVPTLPTPAMGRPAMGPPGVRPGMPNPQEDQEVQALQARARRDARRTPRR